MLPQALRRDGHACVGALLDRIHCGYRRGKVGNVEAFAQVVRQTHLDKIHHQIRPLLTDINAGIGITQVDGNPRLAILTPAKLDIADTVWDFRSPSFGKSGKLSCSAINFPGLRKRQKKVIPLDCRFIGHGLLQIEDKPRSALDLNNIGASKIALVVFLTGLSQPIDCIRKIQRDPGRLGNGESSRKHCQRLFEGQLDAQYATLLQDIHRLDTIRLALLCICHRQRHQTSRNDNEQVLFDLYHFIVPLSCSIKVLTLSTQSPAASCTNSRKVTSPSATLVITPKFCPI